jgi:membrane protein
VDLAALREQVTTTYRVRRDQAVDLVDRVPILGRLVNDFVRIEFIDRCMLIAAQGLLALIPMLVVLAAFFPHLTQSGLDQFSSATGLGSSGNAAVSADVNVDTVRAQTGFIGLLITFFSATSFGRAMQRMHERIWELPHIGGLVGTRRCFLWLVGWLLTLQLVAALIQFIGGDRLVFETARLVFQMVLAAALWLVTARVLVFGRVPWRKLVLGSVLTGVLATLYSRGSSLVMPIYVDQNSDQFGTLGVILAISTWLIGFAAVLVASALVGRVVSEDPTVNRVVTATVEVVRPFLPARWRRPPADATAAPPPGG